MYYPISFSTFFFVWSGLFLVCSLPFLIRHGGRGAALLKTLLLYESLLLVFRFTLFDAQVERQPIPQAVLLPPASLRDAVSLLPFDTIRRAFRSAEMQKNLWGNLLLFLPLGFSCASLAGKGGIARPFLCCALISTLAEAAQIFIRGRHCDVDDLILNAAGGLIGVLLFRCARRFYRFAAGVFRTLPPGRRKIE